MTNPVFVRSSLIVVGQAAGEVVDLTLKDYLMWALECDDGLCTVGWAAQRGTRVYYMECIVVVACFRTCPYTNNDCLIPSSRHYGQAMHRRLGYVLRN